MVRTPLPITCARNRSINANDERRLSGVVVVVVESDRDARRGREIEGCRPSERNEGARARGENKCERKTVCGYYTE